MQSAMTSRTGDAEPCVGGIPFVAEITKTLAGRQQADADNPRWFGRAPVAAIDTAIRTLGARTRAECVQMRQPSTGRVLNEIGSKQITDKPRGSWLR